MKEIPSNIQDKEFTPTERSRKSVIETGHHYMYEDLIPKSPRFKNWKDVPTLKAPLAEHRTPPVQELQQYFAQMLIFLDHAKKSGDIARIFKLTSQALDIDSGYDIGIDRPKSSDIGSNRLYPWTTFI